MIALNPGLRASTARGRLSGRKALDSCILVINLPHLSRMHLNNATDVTSYEDVEMADRPEDATSDVFGLARLELSRFFCSVLGSFYIPRMLLLARDSTCYGHSVTY